MLLPVRFFSIYKAADLGCLQIISISTLWLFMLYSIFYIVSEKWYLQVLLGSIALGVSVYILSFKTKVSAGKNKDYTED